jgi:hypothetical protein
MRRSLCAAAIIIVLPGCMVTEYRQQAVEYSLAQAARARDEIASAAEAGRRLAEELSAAAGEEREAQVAEPMEKLAASLASAHASSEEAGKTLAVVQEDLGRPASPPPEDAQAAEAMRIQYRAASRIWKTAVSWVKSQLPLPARLAGSGQAPSGGGWTPGGIAGLVTAVTAALAGAGEATRRGVKTVRRRMAEKDAELEGARAEVDEAMQALDEVKAAHPKAVKAAADRDRRPNLRRAYVRREARPSGDVTPGREADAA